jgi:hypothetical protein
MPDNQMDKLTAKIDIMSGQMQQMQVDMATLMASSHGDHENVKLRLTSLEAWRESMGRTIVGVLTGIFITVCAGLIVAFALGKFHA